MQTMQMMTLQLRDKDEIDAALKALDMKLLDSNGILKLLPASEYDEIDHYDIQAWCHFNQRYGLPTAELVGWLKDRIGGRKAIEIGSGHGDLAYHLGIPATDSKFHEKPMMQAFLKAAGQIPIQYPDWVKRWDAQKAIARYEPDVVVAQWVTQKVYEGDPGTLEGCFAGVDEEQIVSAGIEYIMIGNKSSHSQKRILNIEHEEYNFGFLKSRASKPENNVVWVWNGK